MSQCSIVSTCEAAGTISAALEISAQAAYLFLAARRIFKLPTRRRQIEWTLFSALFYVGAAIAFSQLAVAAALTEFFVRASVKVPSLRRQYPHRDDARARAGYAFWRPTSATLSETLLRALEPRLHTFARIAIIIALVIVDPHNGWVTDQASRFAFVSEQMFDNLIATAMIPVAERLLPFMGWITSAIIACIALTRYIKTKPTLSELRYTVCVVSSLGCAFLLLTRRPGFAALATLLTVCGLAGLSRIKFTNMRMNLHAYDFVYFLRNHSAIGFLLKDVRPIVLRPILIVVLCSLLLSLVFIVEPAAIDRLAAAMLFSLMALALALNNRYLAPALPHQDYWGYFDRPAHLRHFVNSISEAIRAVCSGGVLATRSAGDSIPDLRPIRVSKPDRVPPTIILILNESTFPPLLCSRTLVPDPAIAAFFRSTDGRTHGLRVEAFGGASWRTEFSVLTGIPTNCYGPFGMHVFHWATNKIHRGLPQYLKLFGYRSAIVYPLPKEFVNSHKFYNSIGFEEILDQALLGDGYRNPDKFHFDRALEWLNDHFSVSDEPGFLYILTMSNHHPHNIRFTEEGGLLRPRKTDDTELGEYVRRLRGTCEDYAAFRAELAKRFPSREFLIVHFGDHQPPFTSHVLGAKGVEQLLAARIFRDEMLYRTYFAIDGVNFEPAIDGDLPDTIEVAYLGTVMLCAAGIPLDPVHKVHRDLMVRHAGRLYFADGNGEIAARLNRRMMEAGLISPH
jgi:hypothetical protein